MFPIVKALLVVGALLLASGCSHPLEIYGDGDIVSSSGTHNCSLEQFQAGASNCKKNYAVGAYQETYTGVPRPGWVFRGWKTYCPYNNVGQCKFNYSAAKVFEYWGVTFWPLKAEFVPDCTGGGCVTALPPLLGAVTDTSIKIWDATLTTDAEFKVRYRTGVDPWSEDSVLINTASGFVGTIELSGLQPDTLYEYETLLNDVSHYSSTFSTLPSAGYTGQIHFGVGTDFSHFDQPFLALGQASAKNFDFMLMVGDLLYSDLPPVVANTVAGYADRYWNTWNDPHFAALGLQTPLFMIWDDHEISNDYWPGKDTPDRYPAARGAYDLYAGAHNPDTGSGVLYYSFSTPGADFFVLDTRSYRSPGTAVDDINKTMLGDTQRNALLDYLENSTAAFKFIVTSVPFSLGEASADTWSAYRTERELIMSEIETRGITNVAFLSGDRHFSGIFRIISPGGYVYYDFLPSPTGTNNRPAPTGNDHPGEEEIVYISDIYKMFGDFKMDLSGVTPTLRAAFVDSQGNDRCVITIGNDETGVLAGAPLAVCE